MINGHRQAGARDGMHYREAIKADVVPNFRLLGVWRIPYPDGSYDGQDVSCWVIPLAEELITVYLGLFIRKHVVPH